MKKVLLLSALALLALFTQAQTKDNPWSIGIQIGSEQYNGDVENQFFDFADNHNGFAGFSVSRYLTEHLDVSGNFTLGDIKISRLDDRGFRNRYNMNQANLHLRYNFFKYDEVKFRPFVFAGAGLVIFDGEDKNQTDLSLPAAGLGLTYKLNEHMNLRYQNTLLMTNADDVEGIEDGGNDMFLQTSIALVGMIRATSDLDQDGVSDKNDECPGTPLGTAVDNKGCALDADGDGVPNEEDKCPDIPGFKFTNGCPDSDGDSIANADDPCPNLPGTLNGCPDSDKDMVADKDDKCPTVAGLPENGGCPEKEEVAEEVPVEKETTPTEETKKDPVDVVKDPVKDPVTMGDVPKELLKNMNFNSESFTIKIKYYDQLTRLAAVLKKQSDLNLEVIGYADSTGPQAYNQRLSEQRADRVKRYLVSKGVSSSRIKAIGKGEQNPIGSNETMEGRAMNRRATLEVIK